MIASTGFCAMAPYRISLLLCRVFRPMTHHGGGERGAATRAHSREPCTSANSTVTCLRSPSEDCRARTADNASPHPRLWNQHQRLVESLADAQHAEVPSVSGEHAQD